MGNPTISNGSRRAGKSGGHAPGFKREADRVAKARCGVWFLQERQHSVSIEMLERFVGRKAAGDYYRLMRIYAQKRSSRVPSGPSRDTRVEQHQADFMGMGAHKRHRRVSAPGNEDVVSTSLENGARNGAHNLFIIDNQNRPNSKHDAS